MVKRVGEPTHTYRETSSQKKQKTSLPNRIDRLAQMIRRTAATITEQSTAMTERDVSKNKPEGTPEFIPFSKKQKIS
ncbi:MAG: hypothetical protein HY860_01160 [Chlamydiales bacterium]|nr:hypothetical protein [Chlamydiales bacterium]